jgi:hypothetical protein
MCAEYLNGLYERKEGRKEEKERERIWKMCILQSNFHLDYRYLNTFSCM